MEEEITFVRRIFNINDEPFYLMINKSLINNIDKDFSWCWYVELQRFFDTENDEEILQKFMVEILQKIYKKVDIKIIGTTLHKNIYEIIFYAKEENASKIAGEFVEMPYELEDREDRFLRYHSKRDSDWENVKLYFDAIENS